jgi:hypothetical protein
MLRAQIKVYGLMGLLLMPVLLGATLVTETRNLVEQRVAVEKTISEEAAVWRNKQETLQSLIQALEVEKRSLQERIGAQRKLLTAADEQRAKVLEREKELNSLHQTIQQFLTGVEVQLRDEWTLLPQALQHKLDGEYQRIPSDSNNTTLGVAERMQTIITILAEIQKFNAGINLAQEMRTLRNGEEREVKTLYLGLGVAYYLAPNGEDAGYGQPTPEGWVWVSDPGMASKISEVIAIYEKKGNEAYFVTLPVPSVSSR